MGWTTKIVVLCTAAAVTLTGCKVNSDDVQHWKVTVKGPSRLVAVVGSDRYAQALRTEAALALVEMERSDVDALASLKKALDDLRSEDPAESQQIVEGIAPRLEELLAPNGTDESGSLDALEVRAKDAAYMVIPYASAETRQELIRAVLRWYSADFERRSLAGDYSAEQVTRALGADAAEQLVDALHEKMAPAAMIQIAEIIGESGNDATKQRAAERLVEIEAQMEKPAFVSWLGEQIRDSLEASGEEVDDRRVSALALYNRENYINEGALTAMRHLAGQEVVTARLLRIADTKPGPNDPDAWVERLSVRRATALRALEGHVSPKHLNRLLSIALDATNPIEVRDYAFDRVGDTRSRAAISKLWPLVGRVGCSAASCTADNRLDKRLRWRAGELVLSLGGPVMIAQFSERLPSASGIQYEPEELEGYATRMSQMTPPPTSIVLEMLNSQQWWNRVVALRYLERRGGESHIPAMRRLQSDEAQVSGQGWSELNPPVNKVGDVAAASIEALRTREQGDQK